MSTSRKQPGVAFWATVVVVVLLAVYPLSFGPACWMYSRVPDSKVAGNAVNTLYYPIVKTWFNTSKTTREIIDWWTNVGAAGKIEAALGTGAKCFVHVRPELLEEERPVR